MSQKSRQYFLSIVWNFLEKFLKIFLALFVGVYVARKLGAGDFGKINYTLSFLEIFYILFTLGIDSILVKLLLQTPSEISKTMGNSLIVRSASSLLVLSIIVIFTQLLNPNYTALILIYGLGKVFQALNIFEFYYQSQVRSNETAKLKIFASLIGDLSKVVFLYLNLSLPILTFAFSLEFIIYFFLILKKYLSENKILFQVDGQKIKQLLKQSFPFVIGGAFITIYSKIDQLMLKSLISEESVGIYAVAVRLTEFWAFIPLILSSTLLPSILEAQKHSEQKFNQKFVQLYSLLSLTVFSIIIFLFLGADTIIPFLYGKQYFASAAILKVQAFSLFFMFIGIPLSQWFMAKNLQSISTFHTGIGCLLNIGLNYFLIPRYQAMGASIATVISYAYAGYFYCFFTKKARTHAKTLIKGTLFSFFNIIEIYRLAKKSLDKKSQVL